MEQILKTKVTPKPHVTATSTATKLEENEKSKIVNVTSTKQQLRTLTPQKRIREELVAVHDIVSQVKKMFDTREQHNSQLKNKLNEKTCQLEYLRNITNIQANELAKYESGIKLNRQRILQLETDSKDFHETQIGSMNAMINESQFQIDSAMEIAEKLEFDIKFFQEIYQKLNTLLNFLQQDYETEGMSLISLFEEIESLCGTLSDSAWSANCSTLALTMHKELNLMTYEDLLTSSLNFDEIQLVSVKLEEKYQALLQAIEHHEEELVRHLEEVESEEAGFSEEINHLQATIQLQADKIESLRSNESVLQCELSRRLELEQQLEDQKRGLSVQIDESSAELSRLRDKLGDLTMESKSVESIKNELQLTAENEEIKLRDLSSHRRDMETRIEESFRELAEIMRTQHQQSKNEPQLRWKSDQLDKQFADTCEAWLKHVDALQQEILKSDNELHEIDDKLNEMALEDSAIQLEIEKEQFTCGEIENKIVQSELDLRNKSFLLEQSVLALYATIQMFVKYKHEARSFRQEYTSLLALKEQEKSALLVLESQQNEIRALEERIKEYDDFQNLEDDSIDESIQEELAPLRRRKEQELIEFEDSSVKHINSMRERKLAMLERKACVTERQHKELEEIKSSLLALKGENEMLSISSKYSPESPPPTTSQQELYFRPISPVRKPTGWINTTVANKTKPNVKPSKDLALPKSKKSSTSDWFFEDDLFLG